MQSKLANAVAAVETLLAEARVADPVRLSAVG
jgi:hypothetical protein